MSHTLRRLVLGTAATLAVVLTGCSSDEPDEVAQDDAPAAEAGVPCEYVADGYAPAKKVDLPAPTTLYTGAVAATIATDQGDIPVELDAAAAPCTVHSFLSLAEQGFFDDTPCHRLTTAGIFVLQCGDPTGTGTGGPGYSFADELSGDETYGAGTLAMANAGPNTNGSQFFIVYDATELPPNYTAFGTVDDAGLEVVTTIAAEGSDDSNGPGDGSPVTPVTITGVTVD